LGGFSRPLYPNLVSFAAPLALETSTNPSHLITAPDAIKAETVSYFSNLYHHSDEQAHDKPWLSTPSVLAIRERTLADTFQWPQSLSLSSL
jgi:hypothetical protein